MTGDGRDRDETGRPLSARPRDALGRPLPYGSPGALEEIDPVLLSAAPDDLLLAAQRFLDAGRPFQAHEILEAGWKRAPQDEKPLWRALAQLAVAITHTARGNPSGAAALCARAGHELRAWTGRPVPHDIDAAGLAAAAEELARTQHLQRIRLLGGTG
jgi:hypothetical protein